MTAAQDTGPPIVERLLSMACDIDEDWAADIQEGGNAPMPVNTPGDAAYVITALYEALATVIAYREGRPPFDFHKLPDEDRSNEAFDAWQKVEAQIRDALNKARGQS